MTLPPAVSVMPSMRPSTWSGTPQIMRLGGSPSRFGQLLRTRSWLPPMPPDVTTMACALSAKSPTTTRELACPRSTVLGSRTSPCTPSMTPAVVVKPLTRWRKRRETSPRFSPSRTRLAKGATMPGPVPQVTWKRGTELPCSVAV